MSVLKSKRTKSSIQYLKTADDIFSYTANFCSRLSPRYTRIFTDATIKMASILVTECGMANAIYPNSDMSLTKYKRPEHPNHWLWNHDFYCAPVEELERIKKMITEV